MVDERIGNAVAVTGGMASGKSTVCRWLCREAGFAYVGADVLVRDLIAPGGTGWRRLRREIPPEFFASDTTVRKMALRRAIFSDPGLKKTVEAILHPLVLDGIRARAAEAAAFGEWCLAEVPLLYECGWEAMFVKVVAVVCRRDLAVARLRARDNVGTEAAVAAVDARLPDGVKAERADFVIDNSGSWQSTRRQLRRLKKKLTAVKKS